MQENYEVPVTGGNQVLDMVLDNRGYLLVLTSRNKLFRFDGSGFENMLPEALPEIDPQWIELIYSPVGDLVFGRNMVGYYLLHPYVTSLDHIAAHLGLHKHITDFCVNGRQVVVVFEGGELVCLDMLRPKVKHRLKVDFSNISRAVKIDDHTLFYSASGTFWRQDLRTGQRECIAKKLPCMDLKFSPYDGRLYFLSTNALFRLTPGGRLEELFSVDHPNRTLFRNFDFIGPDEWVFGSYSGLFRYKSELEFFGGLTGLNSPNTPVVRFMPSQNVLFVGSADNGLFKLQSAPVKHIRDTIGTIVLRNHPLTLGPGGKPCIMTEKGVAEIGNNGLELVSPIPAAGDQSLSYIAGNFFIGTNDSLIAMRPVTDVQNRAISEAGRELKWVHGMLEDATGGVWVTGRDGVALFREGKRVYYTWMQEIDGFLLGATELRDGIICLWGLSGIYLIREDQLMRHIHTPDVQVRAVYEDEERKLWLGTYGEGLFCWRSDTLVHINSMPGAIMPDRISGMVCDDYGFLHFSTDNGLYSLSEKALQDFYAHRVDFLIPFHYGADFLAGSIEFNGSFQNSAVCNGGDIYFPALDGVVRLHTGPLPQDSLAPFLDAIIVNDRRVMSNESDFPRSTRKITVRWSIPAYVSQRMIYYQYKLSQSGEEPWSELQLADSAVFVNLPPGSYDLRVRVLDPVSGANPTLLSYHFSIRPYFFETLWFLLLSVAVALGFSMAGAMFFVRLYRNRVRNRETAKRMVLELELKSAHSQLNPNYIFECLRSIKHFMETKQYDDADKFTDHFSILLRRFLESTETFDSPVSEEVTIIREYLELESMRSTSPFTYSIEVEPGCADSLIPVLFVLPFVENSVKLGFAEPVSDAWIRVAFYRKGEYLICEVEDNGIGRDRSRKRRETEMTQDSWAFKMVESKAEILRSRFSRDIHWETIDKYASAGNTGTKVIIRFAIQYR